MHKICQASTISSVIFIKDKEDNLLYLQSGTFSWLTVSGAKKSLQAHFKKITAKERPSLNKENLLQHGWVINGYDGKLHYIIDDVEHEFNDIKELVEKLFDMEILEIVQIGE